MMGMNRRAFFEKTGKAAAVAGAVAVEKSPLMLTLAAASKILTGCAALSFHEEDPILYPGLSNQKIQPLDDKCMVGFHGCWERRPGDYNPVKDADSKFVISTYENHVGHTPAILVRQALYSDMTTAFPGEFYLGAAEKGVIPFIFFSVGSAMKTHGSLKKLLGNEDFIQTTKNFAQAITTYKVPCFVSTMREMNAHYMSNQPWMSQSPGQVKDLWQQIWGNFEEVGANQFATWVWEIIPTNNYKGISFPETYYPGDQYVDWIGFSAYNRSGMEYSVQSLASLIGSTYVGMRTRHPDKPIMLAEMGKTRGPGQARWIANAFETIRERPGIKAVNYWNNAATLINDDHTLDKGSRDFLREIINKDYFVGAKYLHPENSNSIFGT